jgi:hypothetical protein
VQEEGGVTRHGHPSNTNLSPCCLTWRPCFSFLFSFWHGLRDFRDVRGGQCLHKLVPRFHDLLRWTLPLCLYCQDVIFLLLIWQDGPCSRMFCLVLQSHGTWSGGLIQFCVLPPSICPADTDVDAVMFSAPCFNDSTCLSYIHFSTFTKNIAGPGDF